VSVAEVLTDRVTREKLGAEGLAEVKANLWPVNCQTCGQPLGADPPVLCVDDIMIFGSASLHHLACQAPRWRSQGRLSPARGGLSEATRLLLVPLDPEGEGSSEPLMLVNPSLEVVLLAPNDDRWHVDTVAAYGKLGLQPLREIGGGTTPVPGATARLSGEVVDVQLTKAECWQGHADPPIRDRIREAGHVLLAVATCVYPYEVDTLDDLTPALEDGQIALGWIDLST